MIRGKKKKKKKKKKNDYGEEQSEASYRVLSTSTCGQEWQLYNVRLDSSNSGGWLPSKYICLVTSGIPSWGVTIVRYNHYIPPSFKELIIYFTKSFA